MGEELIYEKCTDGVGIIRLNTPPLNLQTLSSMQLLSEIIGEIEQDRTIRALVLTGENGRVFSAGSDVKEFPTLRGNFVEEKLRFENYVFDRISMLPIPTVCAVTGSALGGGLELALCFDFRVMSEAARLSMPEINLGNFPGSGGPLRLVRLIGPYRAMELISMAASLSAEEALEYHLVTEVVPEAQVTMRAISMARLIAKKPAAELQAIKRLVYASAYQSVQEAAAGSLYAARQLLLGAVGKSEVII